VGDAEVFDGLRVVHGISLATDLVLRPVLKGEGNWKRVRI
jgi:hypothetical protein